MLYKSNKAYETACSALIDKNTEELSRLCTILVFYATYSRFVYIYHEYRGAFILSRSHRTFILIFTIYSSRECTHLHILRRDRGKALILNIVKRSPSHILDKVLLGLSSTSFTGHCQRVSHWSGGIHGGIGKRTPRFTD